MLRKHIGLGRVERFPKGFEKQLRAVAPKSLSLERNYDETVAFFQQIKKLGALVAKYSAPRHHIPRFEIVFGGVEFLSVRSAVIVAAEIDRLRRLTGVTLTYQGRSSISEDVTAILSELGCFHLAEIDHPEESGDKTHSRKTLIKLRSGRSLDDHAFEEFDRALGGIFYKYHSLPELFEGMGEALLNVRHHAYHDQVEVRFPCPGKRWWATACIDYESSELRVFVFDQGVGIPATLPYTGAMERMLSAFKALPSASLNDDATLLKGALEYTRSRTKHPGRGKGFRDIMSTVDAYQGSRLRIASGKAEVTYSGRNAIVTARRNEHVGGTLIEWTLPMHLFDSEQGEPNDDDQYS